ncbi:MAG: hypothetical protein VXZ78_07065, partial [Pseudomonadota bacterium]|nr:hypothetical protein [Pseudomonadota bacterium]
LLVPAMNVRMWIHKATQQNVKILKDYGYLFIGPEKGEMACGEFGEGKMSSPRQIFAYLKNYFDTNFNSWSIFGISKALDKATKLCKNL